MHLGTVKDQKESKSRKCSCTGSDSTAGSTKCRTVFIALVDDIGNCTLFKQNTCCKDGNNGIQDLLQYLGDCRGHHVSAALKITSQDSEISHDPHSGSQSSQCEFTERLLKEYLCNKISSEPQHAEHQKTNYGCIKACCFQYSVGIPVVTVYHIGGNDL